MRPSRYNLLVREGDRTLAVNLLSRAAVQLSADARDALEAWGRGAACADDEDGDLHAFLRENLFLVEDEFDELAYVRERSHAERFRSRQFGMVIAPTMGCNFSCHYCFESKEDISLGEVARSRVLDLVRARIGSFDDLSVQWFGGEPLRARAEIEALSMGFLDLARTHGFAYAATIITNGFLMDAATGRWLRDVGVTRAQITLDGDRGLHDRTRSEGAGGGSFDRILEHIASAPPEIEIVVRVHLAPFNYQSVLDLLDTLKAKAMETHIDAMYVAPLFNYRAGMKGGAYETDGKRFASSREFAAMQIPVLRKARDLGFRLKDFLDVPYGICTAVRADTVVVDARGNLLKCYKDCGVSAEAFSTLDGERKSDHNLDKWLGVDIPRDEECRSCTFLPVCLGGCTKQWQEGADKSVICTPLKFNFEDRIRLYFADENSGSGPGPPGT